jgi:hypothetical protein
MDDRPPEQRENGYAGKNGVGGAQRRASVVAQRLVVVGNLGRLIGEEALCE